MTEPIARRTLSLSDLIMLLQAVIVIGGGFYLAGGLGVRMDALSDAITKLGNLTDASILDHETRIRVNERTLIRLEELK